jgi:hypothetical protein
VYSIYNDSATIATISQHVPAIASGDFSMTSEERDKLLRLLQGLQQSLHNVQRGLAAVETVLRRDADRGESRASDGVIVDETATVTGDGLLGADG